MNKRSDQGQATRAHLVTSRRSSSRSAGYDGTSIEAVLERAGVSRGSLYHHFDGKEALFEAVLHAVEARIGEATLAAAIDATDMTAALRAGCLAWIALAGDPVVRRIVLIDAPGGARLGTLARDRRAVRTRDAQGRDAGGRGRGRIPAELVDPFAHMILATVNELALLIARADDIGAAQRTAEAAVDEFLARLLGR